MEHTQVSCRIEQIDCIETIKTVLFEGEAFSKLGYLSYVNELGKQEYFYDENTMRIVRTADVKTEVYLDKNKPGFASVMSEYGVLHFTTQIEKFDLKSTGWMIEYKIYSEDILSIHTRIECCIFKN
ncbi:hypothetical protein [Anaerorhabdus sp.]|uniref:hypothetical protein n=1 Tax=Anaerorhabdus sp. TaxID=1872524 RepID=UPI002FCC815A